MEWVEIIMTIVLCAAIVLLTFIFRKIFKKKEETSKIVTQPDSDEQIVFMESQSVSEITIKRMQNDGGRRAFADPCVLTDWPVDFFLKMKDFSSAIVRELEFGSAQSEVENLKATNDSIRVHPPRKESITVAAPISETHSVIGIPRKDVPQQTESGTTQTFERVAAPLRERTPKNQNHLRSDSSDRRESEDDEDRQGIMMTKRIRINRPSFQPRVPKKIDPKRNDNPDQSGSDHSGGYGTNAFSAHNTWDKGVDVMIKILKTGIYIGIKGRDHTAWEMEDDIATLELNELYNNIMQQCRELGTRPNFVCNIWAVGIDPDRMNCQVCLTGEFEEICVGCGLRVCGRCGRHRCRIVPEKTFVD